MNDRIAPDLLKDLTPAEKRRLAERLLRERSGEAARPFPLSHNQQSLYVLYQVAPDSAAYHVSFPLRIVDTLDVGAMRRACQALVDRHPMLRTRIALHDGQPMQSVRSGDAVAFEHHDVSGLAPAQQQRAIAAAYARPFDLAAEAPARFAVFTLGPREHVWLPVVHHLAIDGQAILIVLQEVGALYAGFAGGTAPALPLLPTGYDDFVRWQSGLLAGPDGEALWHWWRERLAGPLPVLDLPTDLPRPAVRSPRGRTLHVHVEPALLARLRATARDQGVTLFTLLLAAWQVLLHRHSGQDDILVGCPDGSRPGAEFQRVVGYFVNPLVLRGRFAGNPSFATFLQQLGREVLEAFAHRALPFAQLVEKLGQARAANQTPIFQAGFNFLQLVQQKDFEDLFAPPLPGQAPTPGRWGGLAVLPQPLEQQEGQFDLVLDLFEARGALFGTLKYHPDLYLPATIARWWGHFQNLLHAIVADPSQPVGALPLLGEAERAQLAAWNATTRPYPRESSVPALFEAQAVRTPQAPALSFGGQRLTYAQLDALANRLAAQLLAAGVAPQARVAVFLERGFELPVALLAILKAGAAYVPLVANYPPQRLAQLLDDTAAGWILTRPELQGRLPPHTARLLHVDCAALGALPASPAPAVAIAPDDLAYVMYTSGSTGGPKGVMVSHRNIVRLVCATDHTLLDAGTVFPLLAPVAFDASTLELWGPLLHGGRVAIAPPGVASDADIAALVEGDGVDSMFLTTALFHQLAADPPAWLRRLRQLLVGGEVVSPDAVAEVLRRAPPARFCIVYGPTENTTFSTFHPVQGEVPRPLPIGRAIANSTAWVLDAYGNLAPIGVAGELVTGGDGVALGYLGRPELTHEKFVADPFSDRPGARLYRTGDRARVLPDGAIAFLGRLDRQVKVRGFRVELPEIEQALAAQPGVAGCAVVARPGAGGALQLVAYIVPADDAPADLGPALRRALASSLPDYMVPSAFVPLAALPLSAHGKIDQAALPAPEDAGALARPYRAPATPQEELLCALWAQLLELERVGADDNFFELGGHSLLAMRLAARLRDTTGVEVPLARLFECVTPASQAALLAPGDAAPAVPLQPQAGDESPPSSEQARLWFLDRLDGPSALYNIPLAFTIEGPLDRGALQQALDGLVARHAALRTVFIERGGRAVAVCRPAAALPLAWHAPCPGQEIDAGLRAEALRPFDLAADVLLRASVWQAAPGRHVLLLVVHHIVADGWSMRVLCEELGALYAARADGTAAALAPLPIAYADYARWQAAGGDGADLPQRLAAWRERLAGAPALLDLPTDRPRPPVQRSVGASHAFVLPPALAQSVTALARREGATLFMTLQAAFAVLLSRLTGQDDIVVGTPLARRQRPELQPLVGLFVDLLPLRTRVDATQGFAALLAQVRGNLLQAHAEAVPFDRLVDGLQAERSLAFSPLVQVLFQLEQDHPAPLALPGATVRPREVPSETAKFDLTWTLVADSSGLHGRVEYRTDLFERASVEALVDQYACLLESAVADPARPLGTLNLLAPTGRAALAAWSAGGFGAAGAPPADPAGDLLHRRFEAQARRTPDAIAVSFAGASLSYRALDRAANRLAWQLRERGIGAGGAEARVALLAQPGLALVVGIVGILKAGAGYVPLDPGYPAERLAFMLDDAAPEAVVVADPALADGVPAGLQARTLAIEDLRDGPDEAPPLPSAADRLAYVIYTSGSTGRPKGVMVEHRQVARLFSACAPWFRFGPRDAWSLFHSFAFDFSVWELWGALLHGGRVVVVPSATRRDPKALLALLREERVTVLNQTPSAFRQLVAADAAEGPARPWPALRWIVFGGEALDLPSVAAWMDRHGDATPTLVNMYGITETTVHVTCRPLARADLAAASRSPIGRPLADLQLHVLDPALQPVPPGVIGELYVGGAGMARGYLHRPELTRERFVPDRFAGTPGARLYRTGDLARWRADGELEYLGRSDQQVKIRGFRIEPGEIEAALMQHPSLGAALVQPYAAGPGDTRLAAYVVARAGAPVAIEALRTHLQQRLPAYMVPAAFVPLDALPLTPSGKVDRRALPVPAPERPAFARAFAAPRDAREAQVAQCWAQVLKLDTVGIDDNFFALGGDSILSIELVAALAAAGLACRVQDLFAHQTVRELAPVLAEAVPALHDLAGPEPFSLLPADARAALAADVVDAYPLAALQAGMLFHSAHDAEGRAYHDLLSLHLQAPWNPDALRAACDALVARHPVLRTSFHLAEGRAPLQHVHAQAQLPLVVEDWTALDAETQEAALAEAFAREQRAPFAWSRPPLARLFLRRRAEDAFELTLSVHHAVLDGWSAASFYAELLRDYLARCAGRALPASDAPPPYASYIALELAARDDPASRAYWDAQLAGATATRLPRWGGPAIDGLDRTVPVPIAPALAGALQALAREAGVPLKSVLLAAHLQALALACGEDDVVTGLVSNGRPERAGAERTLGLFLNTLPLRRPAGGGSWLEQVRAVAAMERELLPHRRVPLADLQRTHGELFDTAFNFIHFHVLKDVLADAGLRVLRERGFARNNLPLAAEFTLDVQRGDALTLRLSAGDATLGDAQLAFLAELYQRTLADLAAHPQERPDARRLLPPQHWQQVTRTLAEGPRQDWPDGPVHAAIARVAQRQPDAIALEEDGQQHSYAALLRASTALARHLVAHGAGAERIVALALERGSADAIARLAVLQAGAAFLPLDLTHPPERLAWVLQDARPALVLTTRALRERLPAGDAPVLCLDALGAAPDVALPDADTTPPQQLAYVIYTSGSTGRPKGVLLEHGGLRNMAPALAQAFGITAQDRVLQFAALGFDAAVAELFASLVAGATLVLAPPGELLAGEALAERLRGGRISSVTLPPSALATLPDTDFPLLRTVVVAGEACPAPLAGRWAAGRRLIDGYGPTEVTVCATAGDIVADGRAPAIGRPIANAVVLLLDAQGQPVPVGAPGEICIGGAGVARGYLGAPQRTAERFIASPLDASQRLYRSGDRGRWRPDGQLEYLGRIDTQIKLRGVRIEVEEVESALLREPAIREAVVVLREDAGGARLVACIVGDAPLPTREALRAALARTLPEAMVPAAFEVHDALPRTPNGKFDRQALARGDSNGRALARTGGRAPAPGHEAQLAALWCEVLGVDEVAAEDRFFALGGDSILALQLVAKARDRGLALTTRLVFEQPQLAALARALAVAAPLEAPAVAPDVTPAQASGDEGDDVESVHPLTPLQQGLLFETLQQPPGSTLYFEQPRLELAGPLDPALLRAAFAQVQRRHAGLRIAVLHEGREQPVQVVRRAAPLPWQDLDWRGLDADAFDARLQALLATERAAGFDFARGGLLRVTLVRRADAGWVLVVHNHHLLLDGWSFATVLAEVFTVYRALHAGSAPQLPPAPAWSDYLHWLATRDRAAAEAHWRAALAGREAATGLGLPLPEAGSGSGSGSGECSITLTPGSTASLTALARRAGVTIGTAALAAWALLLARYGRQGAALFGLTQAVRPPELPGSAGLVGLCINTVPACVAVDEDAALDDWLAGLQSAQAAAREHAWLPLTELRRLAGVAPGQPWFESLLVFENYPVDASLLQSGDRLPTLQAAVLEERTQYPLTLLFQPGAQLQVRLVYDRARLADDAMDRLAGHLRQLLQALAEAPPQARVADLDLLDATERHQLLVDFNASDAPLPPFAVLHQAFEQRARATPAALAVIDGEARISCAELDARANHLAWELQRRGVGPDVLVGLHAGRSADLVVAILAILKAGGAWLPLDPLYPAERIAYIVGHARPAVVLTDDAPVALPPGTPKLRLPAAGAQRADAPPCTARANHLAYVLYTSGSTGQPKGVAVEHRSAVALMGFAGKAYAPQELAGVLFSTSICFDLSVFELFAPLSHGGCVIVARDALQLPELPARDAVTLVNTVPSALAGLLAQGPLPPGVRTLNLAGEALPHALARQVYRQPGPPRLLNLYGPTEDTVYSTWAEGDPASDLAPPIGRPLANRRAYVLDARLRPQPLGVAGELYLGGAGLARGYLHAPERTAERFVVSPFAPGERLYRTGDLCRWRADGQLEYIGRLDHQVKLRGFRIELGEIEAVLQRHADVRQAAVLLRSDAPTPPRLVAYLQPRPGATLDTEALRAHAARSLPDYMLPTVWVVPAHWPLTPNGKLDRAALPPPEAPAAEEAAPAPRTPCEEALCAVWASLLGRDRVGIHDDFFALGGDSILALQAVGRARRAGWVFSVRQLFEQPTVAGLAARAQAVEALANEAAAAPDAASLLAPIQQWFLAQRQPEPQHFNQALLLRLRERVDAASVDAALRQLMRTHEALRQRFTREAAGEAFHVTHAAADADPGPLCESLDLAHIPDAQLPAAIEAACNRVQASLDLAQGPLLRALLVDCGHQRPMRLLLAIHHLAVDWVSWWVLLDDLARALAAQRRGETPVIAPASSPYRAWIARLARHAASPEAAAELPHWRQRAPFTPLRLDTELSAAEARERNTVASAREVVIDFPAEDTPLLLQAVPELFRMRVDELLLTALAQAHAEWHGEPLLQVDVESHGRDDFDGSFDLSRTVGWFTALYPVQLALPAGDAVAQMQAVKEQLRAVPRQGLGWGALRWLHPDAAVRDELAALPASPYSFNYLGQSDQSLPADSPFAFADESAGHGHSPRRQRTHLVDVAAFVRGGRLQCRFTFSPALHAPARIEALADAFRRHLRALLQAAAAHPEGGRTAADFPLAGLDTPTLARVLARAGGARAVEDLYPLTPMQQGLLFHALDRPDAGLYVVQRVLTLQGTLDPQALQAAWQALQQRHPVLRTRFVWQGLPQPLQLVQRAAPLPFEQHDWRGLSPAARDGALEELLRADRRRGFDPAQAPLLRLTLLRCDAREWQLVWSHHHLLLDGWSGPLLLRELFDALAGRAIGAAPRPFRDHLAWLQAERAAAEASGWHTELAGFEAATPLPLAAAPNPGASDADGAGARLCEQPLAAADAAQVQAFLRAHGLTWNTLARGAWAVLLGAHAGSDDVVFGAVVAGRPAALAGVESMVGMFVNTLPVRVRLQPGLPVLDWLQQLQAAQARLSAAEALALPAWQATSAVPAGAPLFHTLLVVENYPVDAALRDPQGDLRITAVAGRERADLPLVALVIPGTEPRLALSYDPACYGEAQAARLLAQWAQQLLALARAPAQPLGALDLLPAAERALLLQDRNRTGVALDPAGCAHTWFEREAARQPDAPALRWRGQSWSYGALDAAANALAHKLRERGIGRESRVGLCSERAPAMVVGLLAILKAGGAYLPLDPDYPPERLRFMIEDAGLALLLVPPALRAALPAADVPVLDLEPAWPAAPVAPPSQGPLASDAAYVIYTSGSTGRPKGVVLEHRGVFNLVQALRGFFDLGAGSRVLQFASFSFDAATWEILSALGSGATLCLAPPEDLRPGLELARLLREEAITMATLPPSALAALPPEPFPDLRTLVVAGEACAPALVERWAPGRRFVNGYGPTETTVCATWGDCTPQDGRPPIGRPLPNTRVYVLDAQRRPVPLGAPGELYVGGAGVARGYLGRPGLTAERFLPDPFGDTPGARMYRTGDLCRWREDGRLDYLGRADQQLKIRGYRVEPGEIEDLLRRTAGVADAAVVGRADGPGGLRLAAYVVPAQGTVPDVEAWRAQLAASLPAWMLPADWVVLPALPLTPNGKVDRQALPAPQREVGRATGDWAPQAPLAELVAGVFAEVLGLDAVAPDDDFFALGGHSLLATQVQWRLREIFEVELPLRTLFEAATPRSLARRLEAVRGQAQGRHLPPPLRAGEAPPGARLPLSFSQERLWFLQRLEPGSAFYNSAFALRLHGPLEASALQAALRAVVARHAVLRSVFGEDAGRPWQQALPTPGDLLEQRDLSAWPGDRQAQQLRAELAMATQEPFQLDAAPPVRLRLLRLAPESHVLVGVLHHIVFDGWSAGVLLRQLAQAYADAAGGKAPVLADDGLQYADHALWQRAWLQGEVLADELAWWRARLSGTETLQLPADRPRPALQTYRGDRVALHVPASLVQPLRRLATAHGATLFMALLAGFKLLLHRYSGQRDLVVGTPVAGRTQAATASLVGCFINLLPLRTQLDPEAGFDRLLAVLRETTLDAYAHQELPFEQLVQALDLPRDASRSPLFQVLFTLQNLPSGGEDFAGLAVTPEPLPSPHALYDLSLTLAEDAGGLVGELEFNADLFEAVTAQRMARHWLRLLQAAVADPARPVGRLELLDADERADWLRLACGPLAPPALPVPAGFALQARRTPEAIALEDGTRSWSYGALAAEAQALGQALRQHGVAPGATVAVVLPRSAALAIAMLAVLQASAVLLPLDPALPPVRLADLLADSGCRHAIAGDGVPLPPGIARIDPNARAPQAARGHEGAPTDPAQPAVLIYTSGSTGRPKGVRLPHGALAARAAWAAQCYALAPGERALQFASPGFDVALEEIFPTLLSGATLVLRDDDTLAPDRFGTWVRAQGLTVLNLPTAYWHAWVDALTRSGEPLPPALRLLVVGGERASRARHARWQALPGADRVRWLNAYGPTEATITATVHDPQRATPLASGAELPIGRPVAGVRAYVLDAFGAPVPPGAPGELALGGIGLALGYWQRPDAEAAAFAPDPFAPEPGARLYRTGDLCRWRADGELEFLGRRDTQLKIRGLRVEPAEIEAVLATHPAVREAAVVACVPGTDAAPMLAAALVPAHASPPAWPALRAWLAARLPEAMLPADAAWQPALPLTASGKVDRIALAGTLAAQLRAAPATPGEPPRDALERGVAEVFAEVLERTPVGRDDDFFALGGHSLLALRAVALLQERFGGALPLASLFLDATVAGLAARLREALPATPDVPELVTLQSEGAGRPFFCIAPGPDGGLCYAALARHAGAARPFHVLAAPPQPPKEEDLPGLAARYVAALRAQQPQGPYLLGGWSLGGLLAFEVARQLQASGETVARVVLIDSIAPGAEPSPYRLPEDPPERQRQLAAGLQSADLQAAEIQARLASYARHLDAAARYVPAPAPASLALTVLRATERPAGAGAPDLLRDPALGWGRHSAGRIEVQPVAGDHLSLLREPCVQPLAQRLRALLDAADAADALPFHPDRGTP